MRDGAYQTTTTVKTPAPPPPSAITQSLAQGLFLPEEGVCIFLLLMRFKVKISPEPHHKIPILLVILKDKITFTCRRGYLLIGIGEVA
jgi:hypothetical protein